MAGDCGASDERLARFGSFQDAAAYCARACICASNHDSNVAYAAFNNFQRGDFKPYLMRSADRGKTWTSIAGNLPERHFVWSIVEDSLNKDLLFAGTEFGLFFTIDGGKQWAKLTGGVPAATAFRDLCIQPRQNDLVCATFGRGVFILDDIIVEGNETFKLTLSDVSNANLGSPATTVVTIVDNDRTPRRRIAVPQDGRIGKRVLNQ